MNEVVERVAQSIFDEEHPDDSYDKFVANNPNPQKYVRMARAAIEAMRTIELPMETAGLRVINSFGWQYNPKVPIMPALKIYEAMIDAALDPSQSTAQPERFEGQST
jgi:hypothetical protein